MKRFTDFIITNLTNMIAVVRTSQTLLLIAFQELQRRNRFDSVWFLDGVHHILRKLNEEGYLGPPSQKVLEAFEDPIKEIAIPKAAKKALEALKKPRSQSL
jgi:hypothetical protein